MRTLLKNAYVYTNDGFKRQDLLVDGSRVRIPSTMVEESNDRICDFSDCYILPGFVDVHVHLREPGFSYKEDIDTGTQAAAKGGYTAVCAMPNVRPVPSCKEAVLEQWKAIEEKAHVRVYPYGSITMNQSGDGKLSNMEEIKDLTIAYSDDGKGLQKEEVMEEAMKIAASLDKLIVAHCEDESELKPGGCIHDGEYAKLHHHVGINSASEYKQVQRDIALSKKTGCAYHVCHVSSKESVEAIRQGKKEGVRVTCETGPHYLIYTDMDLKEDGKWKMNPPLRSDKDRKALIEGIQDGTIDCIITDHAPHSKEEKSKGLDKSNFGIVGLETCFAAMYTHLVLNNPLDPNSGKGAISLEKLVQLMCVRPREIFHIPGPLTIEDGAMADLTIVNLNKQEVVDPSTFLSKGKSTLFEGETLQGVVEMTIVDGEIVYDKRQGGIIK